MQNPRDFEGHGGPSEKKEAAASLSGFLIGQPVKHQPEIGTIRQAVLIEISPSGTEPPEQLHKVPEFDHPVLIHVHRIVQWLEKPWSSGASVLFRGVRRRTWVKTEKGIDCLDLLTSGGKIIILPTGRHFGIDGPVVRARPDGQDAAS